MALQYRHQDAPRVDDFPDIRMWARAFEAWANEVSRRLEELTAGEQAARYPYAISSDTALRTFAANGTSIADTNNFLATLVRDLAKKSIIRTKG